MNDFINKNIDLKKSGHAYLFTGDDSDFLFNFAKKQIKNIFSDKKNNNLDNNLNFKVISLGEDEKEIKIDKIKDIKNFFSLSFSENTFKAVLIKDAEFLNKSASNALLKTLEEPLENRILVLTSTNPKEIISTVLSRVQIIRVLTNHKKNVKVNEKMFDLLKKIINSNISDKFALVEKLSKKENVYIYDFLNFCLLFFHDILYTKNDAQKFLYFKEKIDDFKIISNKYSTEQINLILKEILLKLDLVKNTNTNTRIILENLVLIF